MIATWHGQTISIASYNTKSDRPAHASISMARPTRTHVTHSVAATRTTSKTMRETSESMTYTTYNVRV